MHGFGMFGQVLLNGFGQVLLNGFGQVWFGECMVLVNACFNTKLEWTCML
jgi:hypothetical protein